MNKKVSIIIPVYNVEKYINRCINSVINQTYNNIELILVDDCSNDESFTICMDYAKKDNRVIVMQNEKQSGASASRNTGIEKATGDYVMFVDSDDYPCENYVEEMVKTIEEKNVDIVRCKAIEYDKNGNFKIENLNGHENKEYRNDELKKYVADCLAFYSNSYTSAFIWAIIVKRDKLTVRFNTLLYGRNDLVFFIELLLESKVSSIYFLDKPLYNYCYNCSGITKGNKKYEQYINAVIESAKIIKDIFSKYSLLTKNIEDCINESNIDRIVKRLLPLSLLPIYEIRNNVKKTFQNQNFKEFIKKLKLSDFRIKKKILIIAVRLHSYIFVAFYIRTKRKDYK